MHHLNALFSGNEDKEGWHFYRKLAEDQPACSHVFYLAIAFMVWGQGGAMEHMSKGNEAEASLFCYVHCTLLF